MTWIGVQLTRALRSRLRRILPAPPALPFRSDHYLRHNARRLEHLASLGIALAGKTVLETGAGIGDHTHYFLDRSCSVTATDAREDNLAILRSRYPQLRVEQLDLESPRPLAGAPFDVVYCYGLLYHLRTPAEALHYMAGACRQLLLLETCVSAGSDLAVNLVPERALDPTQARSGTGCRPTRAWVFARLKEDFAHVYLPHTQPNHPEFPLDWTDPTLRQQGLIRAIFIAARERIDNPLLLAELPVRQRRHE